MRGNKNQIAFSLIDLLVVIAVLGVLALTVLARPPSKARQASCIANLRQTGNALVMYTDDNNDWLPPGPVQVDGLSVDALALTPTPYTNDLSKRSYDPKQYLVYYLSAYLSLSPSAGAGTSTNLTARVFVCPEYERVISTNNTSGSLLGIYNPSSDIYPNIVLCYSLTRYLTNGEYALETGLPFGSQGNTDQRPHQITALGATNGNNSTVWAVADFDSEAISTNPVGLGDLFSINKRLSIKPVHGNVRNFLFFDNHVGTRKVAGYQDY